MYYADPDGNLAELQADNFGDWAKSTEYMSSSPAFAGNPIGIFFDPDRVLNALCAGQSPQSIHEGIMAEKSLPDVIPTVCMHRINRLAIDTNSILRRPGGRRTSQKSPERLAKPLAGEFGDYCMTRRKLV